MTDYREKALTVVRSEGFIREPVSLIAAALKEVAEEAVSVYKAVNARRETTVYNGVNTVADEEVQKSRLCPDCVLPEQDGPCAFCEIEGLRRALRAKTALVIQLEAKCITADTALKEAEAKIAAMEKKS